LRKTNFHKTFRVFTALLLMYGSSGAQDGKFKKMAATEIYVKETPISIQKELLSFDTEIPGATYSITLCADVPQNSKPHRVAYHQQTGHVFLILQQVQPATTDTVSQVFGFYPKRGLPVLIFKSIKSVIKDNSNRSYDAAISKQLTTAEFKTVLAKCREYAGRIYHINKFNCYDYAVYVFNTVAGAEPVPFMYVKFPFIFGRGGSPVGLYKGLNQLKSNGSAWSQSIVFGDFNAPKSTTRVIKDNDVKKVRTR
jgi:hypothetical protein